MTFLHRLLHPGNRPFTLTLLAGLFTAGYYCGSGIMRYWNGYHFTPSDFIDFPQLVALLLAVIGALVFFFRVVGHIFTTGIPKRWTIIYLITFSLWWVPFLFPWPTYTDGMKHKIHTHASESALLNLAKDIWNTPGLSSESPQKQADSILPLLEKHPFLKKLSPTPPSLSVSPGYVDLTWHHGSEGSYQIRILHTDFPTPYSAESDLYQNPRRVYPHVWASESF